MKTLGGIKEIIDKYEVFILDQWGVMHDGLKAYPFASDCINFLKKKNKKIIIISNSSQRKKSSKINLPILGFNPDIFDEVMTSGEMIWNTIFCSLEKYGKDLKKCFHIYDRSKEDGLKFREGLEKLEFVNNIKDADFILACTPFQDSKPIDYIPILNEAYENKILMFCANPDFETIKQKNNKKIFCMGTIAQLYEEMGGKVMIQGKPSIDIYIEATKFLNSVNKKRIVAIGDSLFHDINGANQFGIDNVLITSGVHYNLFSDLNPVWETKKNKLLKYNIEPTYLCSKFAL